MSQDPNDIFANLEEEEASLNSSEHACEKSACTGCKKDHADNDICECEMFQGPKQDASDTIIDNAEGDSPMEVNASPKQTLELDSLPSIATSNADDLPIEYIEMVERILDKYRQLPTLNYNDLYDELSRLSVKASPTPTLQLLNMELEKVQGAKDRLAEIFVDVLKCHTFKKRAVDLLKDAWGKFTKEKNAESRKGDSLYRINRFECDLAETEALLKACLHILKNLDSHHESLSRRITIIQLQLKLYDIGRGAMPDFDFDKNILSSSDDDIWGDKTEKKEIDKNSPIEAEEKSF